MKPINWTPVKPPAPDAVVPERYRGVWVRTLLDTPELRDTTTRVHWLQTDLWHADLRVIAGVDPETPAGRAQLQGFCGTTVIEVFQDQRPDVCTWHRVWDIQPPRSTPDAGYMVFETPERLVEKGVYGSYLEVWERLPGSQGSCQSLEAVDDDGRPTGERLLLAGDYFMRVRPRSTAWPPDVRPDETLTDVLARHPEQAEALLDFRIDFGQTPFIRRA